MKPANVSICMRTSTYKARKACLVAGAFTYTAARSKCIDNGMFLVPIITQAELNDFNTNVIGNLINELMSSTTNKFWINGELIGSSWISTTTTTSTISAMLNSGTGSCLQAKSGSLIISMGSYQLYQTACTTSLSAMCFF